MDKTADELRAEIIELFTSLPPKDRAFMLRFVKHLPKAKDKEKEELIILVLRMHLMIESTIHDYFKSKFKNSDELLTVNLSFFQKLSIIAASLGDDFKQTREYQGVVLFNKIRNDLAHRLDEPKADLNLKKLVQLMGYGNKEDKEKATKEAIGILVVEFRKHLTRKKKSKKK